MKKYIVQITFKNNTTAIITLKARNNINLELRVAQEIINIFDSLDEVKCIEYEQVKRFTFSKKECYWFVGDTYVGGRLLEKLLKDKSE